MATFETIFGELVEVKIESAKIANFNYLVSKYLNGYLVSQVPAKDLSEANKKANKIVKSYL
jgi:hypothetical protein